MPDNLNVLLSDEVAGYLSQAGRWKIQGFIVDSGFENNSSVEEFKVLSNLS